MTDWIAGAAYRTADDGIKEMLPDFNTGSADLEHIADQSLLIIPMMLNDKLVAYRIE